MTRPTAAARRIGLVAVLATHALGASLAAAATWYVDPAGNDSAAGTAPASAWRSLDRAGATVSMRSAQATASTAS